MRAKLILAVEAFLMASLALGACTIPIFSTSGYAVHLFHPEAGAIYPLGAAIRLASSVQYNASLPAARQITFYANGRQVASTSTLEVDSSSENASAVGSASWTPPAVGEYLVQSMVTMTSGRIAVSTANRVCVSDITSSDFWEGGAGYTGPCPLPPAPAFTVTNSAVSMSASASPDSLSFEGFPRTVSCPPSVTFTAHVRDLAGRVAVVEVSYDALDPSGLGGGGNVTLNEAGGPPLPDRIFSGSPSGAALEGALSGNLVDSSGNSISGNLEWSAAAFDRSGAVLARVGPYDIPASPCGGLGLTPHVIQPLPTETPTDTATPTETFTPSPTAVVCAEGETLIPALGNHCYYNTSTPKPKSPGPAACSSYGNPSACTTHGCKWDKVSSTCN